MEFRREDNNSRLSENERIRFYKHVKPMVAVVECSRDGFSVEGVGWCLRARGVLMTSLTIWKELRRNPDGGSIIKGTTVSVRFADTDFEPAKVLCEYPKKNVVIIEIKDYSDTREWVYSPISSNKNDRLPGKEAFSIHHAFPFTFVACEVANQKKLSSTELIIPGGLPLEGVDKDLELIQLNNFHGVDCGGIAGAPIFNTRGKIIGMYLFSGLGMFLGSGFTFAIDIEELRQWIDQVCTRR